MPEITDIHLDRALAARKPPTSPRILNMQERVEDLIADTNEHMAQLPSYSHERNCLQQVKLALQQAKRELASL